MLCSGALESSAVDNMALLRFGKGSGLTRDGDGIVGDIIACETAMICDADVEAADPI